MLNNNALKKVLQAVQSAMRRWLLPSAFYIFLSIAVWLFGVQPLIQKHNFEDARKDVEALSRRLSDEENGLVFTKDDSCYQSEQGPFDHGKLWCSVGVSAGIQNIDYDTANRISSAVTMAVQHQDTSSKLSTFGSNNNERTILNRISFSDYGVGCVATATYIRSTLNIDISCSDRAKKKYYPYHRF